MNNAEASAPLTSLLRISTIGISPYELGGLELSAGEPDREAAAHLLADDAMRIRCGDSHLLGLWRGSRDGEAPPGNARHDALRVYAGIGFGLPDTPAGDDHLQGLVAELLWNRLIQERRVRADNRELVQARAVKPDPLEPGGDGLAIYRTREGVLVFRLWEIKKHESIAPISSTIRRASKQLALRGKEYLAKMAGPETIAQGGELGGLYADLVELWLDQAARAGVGVSVSTSTDRAPTSARAFRALERTFPGFQSPGQAEGLVVAVPDYPEFANRVREIVWSGL